MLGCGAQTLPPTLPHISLLFSYISPYLPHTPTHFPTIPTYLPSRSQSVAKLPCGEVSKAKLLWQSYHVAKLLATAKCTTKNHKPKPTKIGHVDQIKLFQICNGAKSITSNINTYHTKLKLLIVCRSYKVLKTLTLYLAIVTKFDPTSFDLKYKSIK